MGGNCHGFIAIEPDPYRRIPTNDLSGSRVTIMKGTDGISVNERKLQTCGRTIHLYLLGEWGYINASQWIICSLMNLFIHSFISVPIAHENTSKEAVNFPEELQKGYSKSFLLPTNHHTWFSHIIWTQFRFLEFIDCGNCMKNPVYTDSGKFFHLDRCIRSTVWRWCWSFSGLWDERDFWSTESHHISWVRSKVWLAFQCLKWKSLT